LLIIDFEVGALNPETISLIFAPRKQVIQESGEYTSSLGIDVVENILLVAQDGVCFAGASLAVCENTTVISLRKFKRTWVLDLTASWPIY